MENQTIICDTCERDLTYTGNSEDYRLVVASQNKGQRSRYAAVTDLAIAPPVERSYHFCGLKCLRESTLVRGT